MKKVLWLTLTLCLIMVMAAAYASEPCTNGHIFDETGHCTVCGDQCSHVFDDDGVCIICKWECDHSDQSSHTKVPKEGTTPSFIDNGDNNTHAMIGVFCDYDYCEICHKKLDYDEYECTEDNPGHEKHTYWEQEEGNEPAVCTKCKHVNTCEHENIEEDEYYDWDDNYDTLQRTDTGSNVSHIITGSATTDQYCEDCGMRVNVQHKENYSVADYHIYVNDVCTECGHVNTCEHSTTERLVTVDYDYPAVYQEIEGNDLIHTVVYQGREHTHCYDCETNYDFSYTTFDILEEDTHCYNAEGICDDCGHKCSHNFNTNGYCIYCQLACQHQFNAQGECTICGKQCDHWLTDTRMEWAPGTRYVSVDWLETIFGGTYGL